MPRYAEESDLRTALDRREKYLKTSKPSTFSSKDANSMPEGWLYVELVHVVQHCVETVVVKEICRRKLMPL